MHRKLLSTQLGCVTSSLADWEVNHSRPALQFMPKIIEFLGYDPLPEPAGLVDKLQHFRLLQGWDVEATASELGVYADTVHRWFRGKHQPAHENKQLVKKFLEQHAHLMPPSQPIGRRSKA